MAVAIGSTSLTDRMIRAAKGEVALYEEVEADLNATSQALTVVIAAALASGVGGLLGALITHRGSPVGGLIGGLVAELIGWVLWSYVMYFVGTRMFKGQATYGELLRTVGFAESPSVLLILKFIPALGALITLVVGIWRIWLGYLAVKAALDLDTGNTIATIVIGIVAYVIAFAIIGTVLAIVGIGAAVLGAM